VDRPTLLFFTLGIGIYYKVLKNETKGELKTQHIITIMSLPLIFLEVTRKIHQAMEADHVHILLVNICVLI